MLVLIPLRDQALFLKHNLNAHVIASPQTELTRIETDLCLIRDMEIAACRSINERVANLAKLFNWTQKF